MTLEVDDFPGEIHSEGNKPEKLNFLYLGKNLQVIPKILPL